MAVGKPQRKVRTLSKPINQHRKVSTRSSNKLTSRSPQNLIVLFTLHRIECNPAKLHDLSRTLDCCQEVLEVILWLHRFNLRRQIEGLHEGLRQLKTFREMDSMIECGVLCLSSTLREPLNEFRIINVYGGSQKTAGSMFRKILMNKRVFVIVISLNTNQYVAMVEAAG